MGDTDDFDGQPSDAPNGFWNMLRAAVLDGRVAGVNDGADRYPEESYAREPEHPDDLAGRCLVDGRAWDDHSSINAAGLMSCPGLAFP